METTETISQDDLVAHSMFRVIVDDMHGAAIIKEIMDYPSGGPYFLGFRDNENLLGFDFRPKTRGSLIKWLALVCRANIVDRVRTITTEDGLFVTVWIP